ncbi:MAG TPA: hypothetical protein PK340_00380 [Bacilli bacterium]|nr:hypothetical protein [Bacilli bacterium]
MKLIKAILKPFIILGIILFIIVGLPLILFNMKTEAPMDDYNDTQETLFFQGLDDGLSLLITDPSSEAVTLRITDSFINRMIQKALTADNDKFQNALYEGEMEYSYMMSFGILGVKGVWTTLEDDTLTVTAGADIVINGSRFYQTGFEMEFEIVLGENEEYFLKIERIQVGAMKLPLKQAYSLANSIASAIASKSLNEMIAEYLSFGQFDEEELSFTVGETGLTEYLFEVKPTLAALLKIVYKESLLILDISDEGFDVELRLGTLRKLLTDPSEPAFTKWESDADKAAFMADLSVQAINNAILNPFDPYIDMDEADLNSILDYTLDEDVQFEVPLTFPLLGNDIEYTFASTNLFVKLSGDEMSIHFLMSLTRDGLSGSFDMQFNLSSNVSMNTNGDMVLSILEANIGAIDLDNDMLSTLFSVFDPDLMVDNTLVIPAEDVNEMFEGSGMAINDSYVTGSVLRLHYGLAS